MMYIGDITPKNLDLLCVHTVAYMFQKFAYAGLRKWIPQYLAVKASKVK